MGQDLSQGQLYDVHNEIKTSGTPWLGLLIYYDTGVKSFTVSCNWVFHLRN